MCPSSIFNKVSDMTTANLGNRRQNVAKVLIMGLAESGKSTIANVAFEGREPPPKGARYDATIEYVRKTVEVDGERLTIYDIGGQKAFLDRFTGEMAEFIFSDARSFIYVVDLTKLEELNRAKFYWDKCLENLAKFSQNARVFLFLHKIDIIEDLDFYEYAIKPTMMGNVTVPISIHLTSVYDDSIFKAIKAVIGDVERSSEEMESLIVSFHSKTQANSVELLSIKGDPVPLHRVGAAMDELKKFDRLAAQVLERFSDDPEEDIDKLTGAILETDEEIKIWRKIDDDLILMATYPRDQSLLEIYPSIKSLSSRLGGPKQ